MKVKKLVILYIFFSLQAFSQEKIDIIFNIQGTNTSKTWFSDKDKLFVTITLKKGNKNYFKKEIIKTLRADVKSKYGNFSILLLDYNKNGRFNDFRTEGSKIGSDGLFILKYNELLNNLNKNDRRFIYKNQPLVINGVGFELTNLVRKKNNQYKASLVKTKINAKIVRNNKNGIFIDKLHNVQLVSEKKDTIQLINQLEKGKYLFLNPKKGFTYDNWKAINTLESFSFLLNIINIEIDDNPNTYSSIKYKNRPIKYLVNKTDFKTIFKIGYNNNTPDGILFNDKGEVVLFDVNEWQVKQFLMRLKSKKKSNINVYDSISIYYKIDKYILTEKHKTKIYNFLKTLDTTSSYQVKIVSSADYLGTNNYNFILAKNRAKEIKKILLNKYPKLFTTIKTINKGEISEKEKEQIDKLIGNIKNRKTSILFIKNSITKQNSIKNKKVYIYNPVKKEFDLEIGKKFVLEKLIFHRGTSIIQQRSQRSLKNLLRFLKENPNIEVEIQGHLCCNAGIYQPDKSKIIPLESTNLSTKRARLVYRYLIKNGIRSKRLTYHGYGFQNPLYYPEINEKNKSLNKRVEIVITKF